MTKPGIATTEFWVHNVLQVTSLVLGMMGTVKPQAAAVASGILGVVYIVARAVVKFADAANPEDVNGMSTASQPGVTMPSKIAGSGTVNLLVMAGLLGVLAVGFWGLTACQSTPVTVADNSTRALSSVVEGADAMIANHVVTGQAAANLVKAIVDAEKAQHAWNQAVLSGDTSAISMTQKAALAALAEVQKQVTAAQAVTLQPVGAATLP